ncbi:MAG TPA: hypothetical protein VGH66_16545 [Acidimicrobiales bacterium]
MLVEELAKPAVVIITAEFVTIAAQIARLSGHPSLKRLVLPYPLEGLPDEEVRVIANGAYPELLELLGVGP